jgi:hypothetical protein
LASRLSCKELASTSWILNGLSEIEVLAVIFEGRKGRDVVWFISIRIRGKGML